LKGPLAALPPEARSLLRKRAMPRWIAPMLATLTDDRFSDPTWIFEPKFDGVRCLDRDGQTARWPRGATAKRRDGQGTRQPCGAK